MTTETETPDPNELHDPIWLPGESVTLRAGNRTWAMVKRAETAMQRAALAATGLSHDEVKSLIDDEGEEGLQALIEPLIDPVVHQLSIMRAMILRWTLPYPLTGEGLEQLPEEYGQPIWEAIEARKPAEVPRTPGGGFSGAGTPGPEEPVPVVCLGADAEQSAGSLDTQDHGVDVPAT